MVTKQSASSLVLSNAEIGKTAGWMIQSIMLVECTQKVPSLNPGQDTDHSDTHSLGIKP